MNSLLHPLRMEGTYLRNCAARTPQCMIVTSSSFRQVAPSFVCSTSHIHRHLLKRRQGAPRVSARSTKEEAGDLAAELLQTLGSVRREGGGPETTAKIIQCVEALEAQGVLDAPISGRWTLVYSTQQANRERQTEWDSKALQAVTNRLYKLFFRFAPALAGSQDTGAKNVRNEQVVDLEAGEVDNIVEVRLPWATEAALRVRVWGEVEVDKEVPGGNSLAVTFVGWSFSLVGSSLGQQPNELKLPLPRPRGTLAVTYCDDSLRISRGGRGGIFVTSRARACAGQSSHTGM